MDHIDLARKDLRWALQFELLKADAFVLYRRKDEKFFYFIRYTGENYEVLKKFLQRGNEDILIPREEKLKPGGLYNVNGRLKFQEIKKDTMTAVIAANNYLMVKNQPYNMLFCYEIARWLVENYPGIRLKASVEVNDQSIKSKTYTTMEELDTIEQDSLLRKNKVWFIPRKIEKINIDLLPDNLIMANMMTPDLFELFKIIEKDGKKGIAPIGNENHIIISPIYKEILIENFRARLKNDNDKWGLANLTTSKIVHDFKYDAINVNTTAGIITGIVDGEEVVIDKFGSSNNKELEIFQADGEYGLKDHEGNIVLEPYYEHIRNISYNKFEIYSDGLYGIYNQNKITIPCLYDWIDFDGISKTVNPQSRFVKVCKNDLWGIVDQIQGDVAYQCEYHLKEINSVFEHAINNFIAQCYEKHLFIKCYIKSFGEKFILVNLFELDKIVFIPTHIFPPKIRREMHANFFYANIIVNQLAFYMKDAKIFAEYNKGQDWLKEKEH